VRTVESFFTRARQRIDETTVAEADGEIAGFIMVVEDELEQIYVASAYRGAGVANTLLAEAERQVAAAGYGEAWLAVVAGNTRARKFYERQGWKDEGPFVYEARSEEGSISVPCHRYVRTVT
jgi:ribosomal protein S18 acetylase RimI-like enzyme